MASAVRFAEPGARANDHGWHFGGGAASGASRGRGSSLTLGKEAHMEARPLTLGFTAGIATLWVAYSVVSPKMATLPLLGVLPFGTWEIFQHGPRFQLLLPIAGYFCLPLIAWLMKSKKIAWCIPIAPFAGLGLFYLQFALAMRAFT